MPTTSVLSSMKLRNLMERIEKDPHVCRERIAVGAQHSRYYIGPGVTFQSEHGTVTVLCVVDPEVWFFQGGLVYAANKLHFIDLVRRSGKGSTKGVLEGCAQRPLTRMEVELILGIVSVVRPLECWTIVGSDLIGYFARNRKRIDEWILRIAALLLARMVLKKYARGIYEKVSHSMTDGAWSNLSEAMATDDAFIARFTGQLLGTYKSEAVMDGAITGRWTVFNCIFEGLESLGSLGAVAGEKQDRGLQARAEGFVRSMKKHGINIAIKDVHLYLHPICRHLHEIHNALGILNSTFDGCRRQARGSAGRHP